jgi:hypothetical protein
MRRKTMDSHENEPSGTPSEDPGSEARDTGHRPMGFDCCGVRMDRSMAACPCGSMMRRHPFVTFVICTVMGLALLAIPAGVILGIIAFLRTI